MDITPALATELVTLGFAITNAVKERLRASKGDPSYQPTDAEVLAELHTNAAAVLAEGQAWKDAHPTSASDS